MATDGEDLRPPSSSSSVTTSSEPHPPAPLDAEATLPLPPAEVADAEEEDVVGAWGRPISRFGFHRHGVYRRKPRLFPSSMVANAQRVESIFLRHYRQNVLDKVQPAEKPEELPKPKRPVRRPAALEPEEQAPNENGGKAALAQQQEQQQQQGQPPGAQSQSHPSEEQPDQQEPPQHQRSSSDRKESRRATRSTGKGLDDWLKIPVEATVRVSTGSLETLDGIVYVSVETGRLFKQQGRVYFETMWKGGVYKFFIPDSELPMISEDHPVFKEELARIEEDRVKKLGQAKHMLELGCSNEEATFDIEQRAANNTLEFRKDELRYRMMGRADDTLEELEEEAAIDCLALFKKAPSLPPSSSSSVATSSVSSRRKVGRKSERQTKASEIIAVDDTDDEEVVQQEGAMLDANQSVDTPPTLQGGAVEGLEDPQQQPVSLSPSASVPETEASVEGEAGDRTAQAGGDAFKEGENALPTGSDTTVEGALEGSDSVPSQDKKRRKINAADLAICTLAIASDISAGLQETGYVRDYEYDDIHEVVVDKLYPDPDWGEDEDLMAP